MRGPSIRVALVRLHLWLGLAVGLVWALQGLTGAMLVFHRDIDRLTGPAVAQGEMISLDRMVETAERRTGRPVEMIAIADGRGDLLNLHYREDGAPRQLLVSAASGEVVGERDYDPATPSGGAAARWLYLLHESLLLGEQGETLIGVSGLLLFSTLLTGLWIGWPRRGQWPQAFSPGRWRTTRLRLFGWHRMAGLVAGAVLLVTVPCGIWMIFAGELRPLVAQAVPHQLPYQAAAVTLVERRIGPEDALARARTQFPGAAFVRLTLPTPAAPVYAVRLRQADEVRVWSGVTTVSLDPASGRILDVYDPLAAPLSNRLADAAFSVHSAEIGGIAGRVGLMLVGLTLPALYVTGILAWWKKRRRSARARGAGLPGVGAPGPVAG